MSEMHSFCLEYGEDAAVEQVNINAVISKSLTPTERLITSVDVIQTIQLTVRCQQSSRLRSTIQVGVDSVPCFYVLNLTSWSKIRRYTAVYQCPTDGAGFLKVQCWLQAAVLLKFGSFFVNSCQALLAHQLKSSGMMTGFGKLFTKKHPQKFKKPSNIHKTAKIL